LPAQSLSFLEDTRKKTKKKFNPPQVEDQITRVVRKKKQKKKTLMSDYEEMKR